MAEAVGALERQYDRFVEGAGKNLLGTETSPLPSADELGAEFEDFLRTVADEGEHGGRDVPPSGALDPGLGQPGAQAEVPHERRQRHHAEPSG